MTSVLVLTFNSLIQSHGCNSIKTDRDTSSMPTKSQVQGMIANAMGHDKWDEEQANLPKEIADNLRFAVRDDSKRNRYTMTDYCIARRRNDKGEIEDNDIIKKDYVIQASYKVYLEGEHDYVKKVACALLDSKRQLYLGRKCCVLENNIAWDRENHRPSIIENTRIENIIFTDDDKCVVSRPHIIECGKGEDKAWASYMTKSLCDDAKSIIDNALNTRWQPQFSIVRKTVALRFGYQEWSDLISYSVKTLKYGDMEEV